MTGTPAAELAAVWLRSVGWPDTRTNRLGAITGGPPDLTIITRDRRRARWGVWLREAEEHAYRDGRRGWAAVHARGPDPARWACRYGHRSWHGETIRVPLGGLIAAYHPDRTGTDA